MSTSFTSHPTFSTDNHVLVALFSGIYSHFERRRRRGASSKETPGVSQDESSVIRRRTRTRIRDVHEHTGVFAFIALEIVPWVAQEAIELDGWTAESLHAAFGRQDSFGCAWYGQQTCNCSVLMMTRDRCLAGKPGRSGECCQGACSIGYGSESNQLELHKKVALASGYRHIDGAWAYRVCSPNLVKNW